MSEEKKPESAPPEPGVFHRYIGLPFEDMVLQGSSARQLSLAVAIGVTFGVFPIMGGSILFCFLAALALGAPQPVTHAVSYAVYPIQIPMIFVFVRFGEWLVGATPISLMPTEIIALARADFMKFIEEFGLTCLHAALGWVAVAPFLFFATLFAVRPVLERLRAASPPAGP